MKIFTVSLVLALAWLVKPKVNVVIPNNQPLPKYLRKKKKRVPPATTLQKRPVKIAVYLNLDIIKFKFTKNFDRCAILSILNCLTRILSLDEFIHNYKLVCIKADGSSRIFSLFTTLAYTMIDYFKRLIPLVSIAWHLNSYILGTNLGDHIIF